MVSPLHSPEPTLGPILDTQSKSVEFLFVGGVMACMLNSDSRRLYSWWWDSHISPKNSKWLQENLTAFT
ncbi:KIP1-like protein [Cynara cardunculus var. scolymus]|uniref:KIP1-like protein n=1 Tax=Cynara cardunculus var. scolymus TaxID=59895 RepID=A0A103Y3A0_CYNCS|nr:KIP1-like protein [Cynara cardunculus var. scolymus]